MKDKICRLVFPVLVLPFLFVWGSWGQSSGQNYVQVRTMLDSSGSNSLDEIQYFDGLGRPSQTVLKGKSSAIPDRVILTEYDFAGRPFRTYQPYYNDNSASGGYVTPSTLTSNVGSQYPSRDNSSSDSHAYTEILYEASPLNRESRRYGPGSAWRSFDRKIQTDYLANTSRSSDPTLSCRYYRMSSENTVVLQGEYATGELYVTKTTDEDNLVFLEFKDKQGRIILTRTLISGDFHGGGLPDYQNDPWADTYYIYDDFSNLCCVLPPEASDAITKEEETTGNTTYSFIHTTLEDFAFLYHYDGRNRCKEKKLPGAEWIHYVYDYADRLILSQDGNQRVKDEWSFNKYDPFGRVIVSGVYTDISERPQLESEFWNDVIVENRGGAYGYTWVKMPRVTYSNALVINHYDDYEHLLNQSPDFRSQLDYNVEPGYDGRYLNSSCNLCSAKGLLTGTRMKLLDGSGNEVVTAYYYNDKGRMIQSKSTNHLGGVDKLYMAYTFTGEPTKKKEIHTSPHAVPTTEEYVYTYDAAGRLKKTTYKVTENQWAYPEVTFSEITYDKLGRIEQNKTANNLQPVNYQYNVRNWITKQASHDFTEELYYHDNPWEGGRIYFGGNIAGIRWKSLVSGLENTERYYTFVYDDLGFLRNSGYGEKNNGTWHNQELYSEHVNCDKNGNIYQIVRSGKGDNGQQVWMDIPSVVERKGNRIVSIHDGGTQQNSPHVMEFKNLWESSPKYTYDGNGNMITDKNKGIRNIEYNYLNLPNKIEFASGARIDYLYDAGGTKLRMEFTGSPMEGDLQKDYVNNKVYINNQLMLIRNEGGYMNYENVGWDQFYVLKDHLGNNRVINYGGSWVYQTDNYYPFGLSMTEGDHLWWNDQANLYTYKFGDKELSRMSGLNIYDFGARTYDPAIGRFMQMDPLAEKYYSISPYVYCGNNPINRIDPTGMDWYRLNEDGGIELWMETDDKYDQLYAPDYGITNNYLRVNDKGLLPQLVGKEGSTSATTSNSDDAFNVFKFAADNTESEWVVHKNEDEYTIGTKHHPRTVGKWKDYGIVDEPSATLHSHPDVGVDVEKEKYSMGFSQSGSKTFVHSNSDWENVRTNVENSKRQTRLNYVYFPNSKRLYHVGYEGPVLIRNITDYKKLILPTLKNNR